MVDLPMGSVFVIDLPEQGPASAGDPPVVVLHGFPSCSFDWREVLDALGTGGRRVVLFDFVGFGLSDKPDRRYGIEFHADTTAVLLEAIGIDRCVLVTHDMGDSVGGEILARAMSPSDVEPNDVAPRWSAGPVDVVRRVVSNGSIYLDLADLTAGQQLLMSLPDEKIGADLADAVTAESFSRGLGLVFSADHPASDAELVAQSELAMTNDGLLLMPRLIRYLEDRRRAERRYTGAIETHPSPLTVIWGEVDPVARFEMVEVLEGHRSDASIVSLDGVGHYPMIEDPISFGAALATALSA